MPKKLSTYTAALWNSICGCFFADKRCLGCHAPFTPHEHKYLCPHCQPLITLKPNQVCQLCGHNLETNTPICLMCTKDTPPWDSLDYYGKYNKLLKSIIKRYKFKADFSLIPLLQDYLYQTYKNLPACDIIIPMPRHEKRLVSEGFNHVFELCRPLAKQLNIPLQHKSLTRTRYTPPQSSLTAKQRLKNPQKSFIASNVQDKNVLLIDDIITTGSTLNHACLALRQAGAKKIYIIVIARVDK